VAVVSHGFFPTVGGSERYHLFTARALADDSDVEVFTSALNHEPSASAVRSGRTDRVGPLTVHYLPSRWVGTERLLRARSLWSALWRFRPDLVWGTHPSPSADLGALFAIGTRVPWVATFHADVSTGRRRNRWYLGWEMRLLRRASAVLVTSERYGELLRSRGIRADRITVVPTGPYIGDGVLPKPARVGAGADPDAPFLFVGALDSGHSYKRLDLLIEAVATLARGGTPVTLDVVGGGDRRAEFENLARSRAVAERVRFLGPLDDDDLADRFAAARALVIPAVTNAEGFGTVAVEAIQYGCPVIVSRSVPIARALFEGNAGLVFDPGAPGALATEMRRLQTDPSLRRSLAAGAVALASQFQWTTLLPRMTAPARGLLGSAPGSMAAS
jgi:glycosyltransferase involved in cell wall biosynthesis